MKKDFLDKQKKKLTAERSELIDSLVGRNDQFEKLGGATEPKIKYTNEDGGEVEIPLTFRGGIRSLFVLSNPLLSIC